MPADIHLSRVRRAERKNGRWLLSGYDEAASNRSTAFWMSPLQARNACRAANGSTKPIRSISSTSFHPRPLHVALHPTMPHESACVLSNGEVHVLQLERHAHGASGVGCAPSASTPRTLFSATLPRLTPSAGTGVAVAGEAGRSLYGEGAWAVVEYAEHPRTLYQASGAGVWLADLRQRATAQPVLLYDATALPLPELRAGCLAVPHGESSSGTGGISGDGKTLREPTAIDRLVLLLHTRPASRVIDPKGQCGRLAMDLLSR